MCTKRWGVILAVVVAAASCVIPGGPVGSAQPGSDPLADQAARGRAQRQAEAARQIAKTYDDALDAVADGDRLAHARQDEDAARRYEQGEHGAGQLLAWFADGRNRLGRGADVRYATQHDGALDESTLLGNLHTVQARAHAQAQAAHDRAFEHLAIELGAKSPGQRAVLRQRGRPEIHKTKRQTCWSYHTPDADETYCWKKNGKLAKHDTKAKTPPPVVAVREPDPPPQEAPAAQDPPAASDPPADPPAQDDSSGGNSGDSSGGGGGGGGEAAASGDAIVIARRFFAKSADCRAIVDHASYECDSADCRAIVDGAAYECESADCRATVDKAAYECESADCRATVDKASYECESADCRAVVDHASYECDSANCRAIVDKAAYECN